MHTFAPHCRIWLLALAAASAVFPARAEDAPSAKAEPAPAAAAPDGADLIKSHIAGLSSADAEVREAAAKALAAIGDPAVPALKKAASGGSAELRTRVKDVLKRIENPGPTAEDEKVAAALKEAKVNLDWQNAPLDTVVNNIGKAVNVGYVISPAIRMQDVPVTIRANGMPADEALRKMLGKNLAYVIECGTVIVVPQKSLATRRSARRKPGPDPKEDADAKAVREKLDATKVELEFQQMPVEEGIAFIRKSFGVAIEFDRAIAADPGLKRKIVFRVREKTLEEALRLLLIEYDLTYVVRGRQVLIVAAKG